MYCHAIASLEAAEEAHIRSQIDAWASGTCDRWKRVVVNIQAETALPVSVFIDLLRDFYSGLVDGAKSAESAWIDACRLHQFKGREFFPHSRICLGRAAPLSDYAALMSDSPGISLSADQCETLVRSVAMRGFSANARETRLLRRARIGRYVVWATLGDPPANDPPFEHLPRTTEAIRTALGLGECSETETLVLLSYHRDDATFAFELFRPTIAEAAQYCWYCPASDAAAEFGWTRPLDPNPDSLPSQSEIVHREINGDSLVFPLYLVV